MVGWRYYLASACDDTVNRCGETGAVTIESCEGVLGGDSTEGTRYPCGNGERHTG